MVKRWMIYLACLLGCGLFFIFYRQWFSYLTLVGVVAMPWLSLVLSLPAMLTAKVRVNVAPVIQRGTPVELQVEPESFFPLPRWRIRLRIERVLTGQYWLLEPGYRLPTENCGYLVCLPKKCVVYDFLGLFRLPMKMPEKFTVSVRPLDIQTGSAMTPDRAIQWRPKRGGGFSENHELRLYRPGDSIRQIHWKLSGKTGELILREPMEPSAQPVLALSLWGTPDALDRKLDTLLHLGKEYLQNSISFQILALTGAGQLRRAVSTELELYQALDAIMAKPPARGEMKLPRGAHYHYIGGGQT